MNKVPILMIQAIKIGEKTRMKTQIANSLLEYMRKQNINEPHFANLVEETNVFACLMFASLDDLYQDSADDIVNAEEELVMFNMHENNQVTAGLDGLKKVFETLHEKSNDSQKLALEIILKRFSREITMVCNDITQVLNNPIVVEEK